MEIHAEKDAVIIDGTRFDAGVAEILARKISSAVDEARKCWAPAPNGRGYCGDIRGHERDDRRYPHDRWHSAVMTENGAEVTTRWEHNETKRVGP